MIETKQDHTFDRLIGLANKSRAGVRHPELEPEMLVEVPLSSRRQRRLRRIDSSATARKSRSRGDRQMFNDARQLDSALGMARVYFQGAGTPAMQENVRRAVAKMVRERATETGQEEPQARQEVEGRLWQILDDTADQ